ncbi:hypothetical protein AQUCO_03700174v1 [Aquilegia coerulea]|uniref:Uncharacterized protein n=1 Tax=Aquilegia coerulea TaxID=218851 RepID=A0A2G5CTV7_AQUCA|nr:hypothetical protein AQUCO_03700174v1 [Aquilegia coerulea]
MVDEFLVTPGFEYFFCPFAFHPLHPELVLVRFRRFTAWIQAEVSNSSINLEESLYCLDSKSTKVVNKFYPRLDLIIPFLHPAWIPILRDT